MLRFCVSVWHNKNQSFYGLFFQTFHALWMKNITTQTDKISGNWFAKNSVKYFISVSPFMSLL